MFCSIVQWMALNIKKSAEKSPSCTYIILSIFKKKSFCSKIRSLVINPQLFIRKYGDQIAFTEELHSTEKI